MRTKVQLNNKSIETAGYKKDYKAAIAEYIWNSLEANATYVEIVSHSNEIGGLDYLEVIDNGDGIEYESLEQTFGQFLFSKKNEQNNYINGTENKGKGRYSFIGFANTAKWETIYEKEDSYYKYDIIINAGSKDFYDSTEKVEINKKETGTKLSISGITNLFEEALECEEMRKCLLNSFAWYLFLNRSKNIKIIINGKQLLYDNFIDSKLSEEILQIIDDYKFNIFFIKWNDDIKQKYFYYFQDTKNIEKYKEHTSFNNNAIDFFHSVYIVSNYFDKFAVINTDNDNQLTVGEEKNQHDIIFRKLKNELNKIVNSKQKKFVKIEIPKIIDTYEKEGYFPKFAENKYAQSQKQDLITVVKEIYCIQPRIFHKSKPEHKKSIIGFLNLLLKTDERENIITIIDSITKLTDEERRDLASVLKKSSLSRIIATLKMIENRYKVIELLKQLVYINEKFTSERIHLQKAIEENYWLFGEQYNLVSADENFEKMLKEYLYIIDNGDSINYRINNQNKLKRPDIFISRQRPIEDSNETQLEENIIVELKSPSVLLTNKVYRQIEDYMNFISKESRFNSQLRRWKFIAICSEVDEDIKGKYEAFKDKGKRYLVYSMNNFEIYAMTWDDVFKSFEIRHRYLYEKLNFDKNAIEEELALKGIVINRDGSNIISDKLQVIKGIL